MRLFLEDTASQWYSIFLKTNSLSYSWEFRNNSFIDTFNQKSWSEIAYAYNYKYLNGSFLDFALKKRNLLIDIDPELTIKLQINLIMITLPRYVSQRIGNKDITKIDDLMFTLRQIEPKDDTLSANANSKHEPRNHVNKPCAYCESAGFPNRLHPEELCRTKKAQQNKIKNDKIKLQNEIACSEELKNE